MKTELTSPWAKDLSDETSLREGEERFRGAFESAATGFSLVDLDGTIRAANRSMCAMLGYTEDEMLHQTFESISHRDDTEPAASLRRQLVNGRIDHFQIERRCLHKDGHIIWVEAAAALVHVSDGPPYFVVQLTDITRYKNAEEALARHSNDLERSNEDLQSFAYIASHDLQQPLRTVSSYAHLLAERYHGYLDERADRWLEHMTRGVDRMHHLIADLLQLSQLRQTREGFSRTALGPIVGRVWDALERQYSAGAHLTCDELPTIMADAAQMELLMQNLIDNSFKYRRTNVPLEVKLSAERHDVKDHAMWEFALSRQRYRVRQCVRGANLRALQATALGGQIRRNRNRPHALSSHCGATWRTDPGRIDAGRGKHFCTYPARTTARNGHAKFVRPRTNMSL